MNYTSSKNQHHILIKKASGEEEPFSSVKLERSLRNAGAQEDTIIKIVADINSWISPGISTKKIYRRAFSILYREKTISSLRYRLKQAILELGPTGYPFEVLIGQLFDKIGFETEVGVVIDGNCITHEMDVIATNANEQFLAECKYHKDQGKQVSIQVPLYVNARVQDIINRRQHMSEYQGKKFTAWVITNTRFSSDSIKYGKCAGLKLLAWDYPHGSGLKERLEQHRLYPVTVLRHLTIKEKQLLLGQDIVACSQLHANTAALTPLNLRKSKYNKLLRELNEICG